LLGDGGLARLAGSCSNPAGKQIAGKKNLHGVMECVNKRHTQQQQLDCALKLCFGAFQGFRDLRVSLHLRRVLLDTVQLTARHILHTWKKELRWGG
jgi:hypothetical protein